MLFRSEKSSIMELLDHNVTVGLGVIGNWAAQNTRFDLAWVSGLSTEQVLVCYDAQSYCIWLDCHRGGWSSF